MKFLKTFVAAVAIAFSTANCALLDGLFGGIDVPTFSYYYSEGTATSPMNIPLNSSHYGSVDGSTSSYYVVYGSYNTMYTVEVSSLVADADLYIYATDSSFTSIYSSSINSGTLNEKAFGYTNSYLSNFYFEVRPIDPAGTDFYLLVY